MSVKLKNPGFFKNNLYLMVVAAWLITLSFIIDNYWSSTSNIKAVQNKMDNYVNDAETDFIKTLYDSSIRQHMERTAMSEKKEALLQQKYYFIYLYNKKLFSQPSLQYWSSQAVLPDDGILASPQKAGFAQLSNGFYVWNKVANAKTFAIALIPVKWNYIVTNNPRTGVFF